MSCLKNILSLYGTVFVAILPTVSLSHLGATWTTPVQISSSNSDLVDIAVDLAGNAVAGWQGYDGTNYIIQSSSLPFGGSWSTPSTLSESGQDAQGPEIAVDASGNAVAIWSRYNGESSIIQGATLPFGSIWSAPVNISDSGGNAGGPELSMDYSGSVGNAVAVWHRYNGTNFIIQSSELLSGGSWSSPANISPSGQDALIPEIAVDPNGNAVAVCARYNGQNFTSRSAIALYGETWSPSFVISNPGETASQGSVSVDQDGNATIVWSQFDGSNYVIQASTIPYGGSLSTPETVSIPGQNALIPMVDADPRGNATMIWVRFDGSNYIAQTSTKLTNGSWSTPVNLSSQGKNVANVSIKVNRAGNAVAVWDEMDETTSIINSATHLYNGIWSSPISVSNPENYAYLPVVDIDDAGNAVCVWLQFNGTDYLVFGSTLPFGS